MKWLLSFSTVGQSELEVTETSSRTSEQKHWTQGVRFQVDSHPCSSSQPWKRCPGKVRQREVTAIVLGRPEVLLALGRGQTHRPDVSNDTSL